MCAVDKNQLPFISKQFFFEPARIQKQFLSQLKVQGICGTKKSKQQKDRGNEDDLKSAAIDAYWLNKLFFSLKVCKLMSETYFKHISFSTAPPAQ